MKKLTFTLIAITLLATGTAFGAVAKKVIEVLQKDNIAIIYPSTGEIKIYKVDDGKNTCYISDYTAKGGSNYNVIQHALSCVKN